MEGIIIIVFFLSVDLMYATLFIAINFQNCTRLCVGCHREEAEGAGLAHRHHSIRHGCTDSLVNFSVNTRSRCPKPRTELAKGHHRLSANLMLELRRKEVNFKNKMKFC